MEDRRHGKGKRGRRRMRASVEAVWCPARLPEPATKRPTPSSGRCPSVLSAVPGTYSSSCLTGVGHISRTHSVASSILSVQELYTVGTYLRALALPSHRPSQHVAKVTLVPREKKRLEIMTLAKATYAAILTIHITNPPEIIINWEWSPTFRQIEQLEWHEHKTQRASSFGCCKLLQIPFPQNVPKDTPKECRELSREIAAAFWKWFGLQILMSLEAGSLCDALRYWSLGLMDLSGLGIPCKKMGEFCHQPMFLQCYRTAGGSGQDTRIILFRPSSTIIVSQINKFTL